MMNDQRPRHRRAFHPVAEGCESRLLLSATPTGILELPGGVSHPLRPNTPVLPFGATSGVATFIDPTVGVLAGNRIAIGVRVYIAPFAGLDATDGAIRIGQSSAILDNAVLVANPSRTIASPVLTIGEAVIVSPGAMISGGSQIGGFGVSSGATNQGVLIGPNARIKDATIEPGVIVGAGASVSGVTVPSLRRVLPLAVVTTQAEASDPSMGKVVIASLSEIGAIGGLASNNSALAVGYTTLYQGQSNTGPSGSPVASTTLPNFFNGNLAAVRGTSKEAGSPTVAFQPTRRGPRFLVSAGKPRTYEGNYQNFPARITGGVVFGQTARQVQKRIGKHVAIRGDEGQPITIGSIAKLGSTVTIHAPRGGNLTIGENFRAGSNAVILGGAGSTIGNAVTIGSGAVVENSKIGAGARIGDGAFVFGTTLPAGAIVASGAVIVNGMQP